MHIRNQDWQQQISRVVDGYLAWKAGFSPRSAEDASPWDVTFVDFWGTCFSYSTILFLMP